MVIMKNGRARRYSDFMRFLLDDAGGGGAPLPVTDTGAAEDQGIVVQGTSRSGSCLGLVAAEAAAIAAAAMPLYGEAGRGPLEGVEAIPC